MKFWLSPFAVGLFCMTCLGQDFPVSPKATRSSGYSYEQFPFPDGIKVYTLEKERIILGIDSLTLIEIWSSCCGAEPSVWARVRGIEQRYASLGLKTYSVNFENGADAASQFEELGEFIKDVTRPANLYLDTLGYTIDYLHVPGFPTYYLVSEDGTVVFRTNGKDEEGVSLLETEIRSRLGT